MNKLLKIFLTVLLTNIMLMATAFATPLSDQLQMQKSKLQKDKNSLQVVQNKREDIEKKIEDLDNQIEDKISKISKTKNLVSQKQLDIKNTELEIQKIDKDIAEDQELYNTRIRAMYINGNDSFVSIVLSSNGFSDLITRIDNMKRIAEFDNEIIKELNDKKSESNNKKDILIDENKKLLALNNENEADLAQLQGYIVNQKSMIAQIKSEEFALASSIDLSQVAVDATLKQIAEIKKAVPKISASSSTATLSRGGTAFSSGGVTISDNNVIAYAINFLGTPYLWGGTSPSGFDCSGFTQYVYAHFGVSVGRTTYEQIKNGVGVAREDLQAGDLVFFGTNGPTHTGMYIGNGTYIHAPRTGDVIKISPLVRSDYITARRVNKK
ncbi:MAG: C40 family peptidase [Clostridiaceae bacterium]|nr:C40 family peptidase [Clostridiaceae bacterium]